MKSAGTARYARDTGRSERCRKWRPPSTSSWRLDLAPPGGTNQFLALGPSLGTRTDFLLLEGDLPAAAHRVLAHGSELHREGLLVMGRYPDILAYLEHRPRRSYARYGQKPLQNRYRETPLWLHTRLGYTATWAGLVLAPGSRLFPLPDRRALDGKVDARWIAVIGIAAFAVACFMRSDYAADGDFRAMIIPMLVQGVALATFFISMTTLTLNGFVGRTVPQASSLATFARITAGSFAVALTTTAWERIGTVHQTRIAEVMGFTDPTFSHAVTAMRSAGAHGCHHQLERRGGAVSVNT